MAPREAGSVFAYPYLWRVEEGVIDHPKDRTTCLAILKKITTADGTTLVHLFLLGITDHPRPEQDAVEIPETEKRRAGLDPIRPAFIVLSEYNYDVLPLSWWYDPDSKDYGRLSQRFTADVRRMFLLKIARKAARRADRTN